MFFVRGAVGGLLMGLANLVPGISGGTMLLAAGVYPEFVDGVAQVTTFRFRARSLSILACIVGTALVAIVSLAGLVSELVIHHRWAMYSLFIGLTLGGVPVIWRLLRPLDARVVVAAAIGLAAMAGLALADPSGSAAAASERAYLILFVAGLAGGSAMVLPGISGGYLLLILGQYVTILTAIDAARRGVQGADWPVVWEAMHVFVPVGLGVVVGVVGVSNLVRFLLGRFRRATLGVLLGLLLGAVLGLWPFREPVPPEVGDVVKGVRLASQEMVDEVAPKDWPARGFSPSAMQGVGSLVLVGLGFAGSVGVGRLGREKKQGG